MALKKGEKVLFGISFLILLLALFVGYKVYTRAVPEEAKTIFHITEFGAEGYQVFKEHACHDCHRALRMGEPIHPELDGEGTKRTREWIKDYLDKPTSRINPTLHDGKFATDFSDFSAYEKAALTEFLFGLKAKPGSASYYKSPDRMRKEAEEAKAKAEAEEKARAAQQKPAAEGEPASP